MRYVLALPCFIPRFASPAAATSYGPWPPEYCNSEPLPITDISAAEIYISDITIPRVPGSCTGGVDVPPPSAIIATVSTPDTTLLVDLTCGKTYFFVMRIQAGGQWSNFAAEAMMDLLCGRPNIPIIIRLT